MTRMADLRDEPLRLLSRGGLTTFSVDLNDDKLIAGKDFGSIGGNGIRFMRHGSNPGARFELKFSGRESHNFFAPGQAVRGGFEGLTLKRSALGARIGQATFAVLSDPQADLTEDLIVAAIGPVDLLGKTNPVTGDFFAVTSGGQGWVTIPEDADPTAAYATQVGAFDASGWKLLRVYVKGADLTDAIVHFFHNPSYSGTNWAHATPLNDQYVIVDSPTSGFDIRVFMVPWGGRGVGCPAVYGIAPGALTGVDMIIQGVE